MATQSARVSLIYPSDGLCYKWARARTRRMPLGLAYVGAALLKAGHQVKVVDASLYDLTTEETVERALSNDPQFVGVGCTTPLYHQAVEIIALIKKRNPSIVVIMGGPHVSALPQATLKTSKTDFVCIGEGEESIVAVLDAVLNKRDPADIPSIAYSWSGYQGHNKEYRQRISQKKESSETAVDLNKTPIPARDLFDYKGYVDHARDFITPQTQAMFSRGCPGKCSFCGAADTLVRWRNLDNVFAELELIQKMGITNVSITDDTYTNQKKRVIDISKGIVERGIKLNLAVQLRLDQLDKEMCDALHASGIQHVGPGIESGNEDIIKQIGKGPRESKEHMRRKVRLLQEYDWKIRNSYVMGMPGETEAQIMETIEFAKELGADENAFSIIVPYPDSPLWHTAKKMGKVDDEMDFSKFLYYHEIGCNMSAVPTERLLELHEFAYEYVGNPAYKLEDNSVSSGHRPHVPYLASEAFRKHREAAMARLGTYAYDNYERKFDEKARETHPKTDEHGMMTGGA